MSGIYCERIGYLRATTNGFWDLRIITIGFQTWKLSEDPKFEGWGMHVPHPVMAIFLGWCNFWGNPYRIHDCVLVGSWKWDGLKLGILINKQVWRVLIGIKRCIYWYIYIYNNDIKYHYTYTINTGPTICNNDIQRSSTLVLCIAKAFQAVKEWPVLVAWIKWVGSIFQETARLQK